MQLVLKSVMDKCPQTRAGCQPHFPSLHTPKTASTAFCPTLNTGSGRTPNLGRPGNCVSWIMTGCCLFLIKCCCKTREWGLCSRMTAERVTVCSTETQVCVNIHKFGAPWAASVARIPVVILKDGRYSWYQEYLCQGRRLHHKGTLNSYDQWSYYQIMEIREGKEWKIIT